MERSNKRGKIPQSDWPLIMQRYDAGETLASIARTYDCSPPAISYVVSRSRARQAGPQSPSASPAAVEPQLVKAEATATAITKPPGHAAAPENASSPSNSRAPLHHDEPVRHSGAAAGHPDDRHEALSERNASASNGALTPPRPPAVQGNGNGDARRTLHLSLGSASLGNGTRPIDTPAAEQPNFNTFNQPARPEAATVDRPLPQTDRSVRADDRRDEARFAEAPPAPSHYGPTGQGFNAEPRRKEPGAAFIDRELRARVDGDITAFLAAFDRALAEDTLETRSALREATDRLLRAGARTRIELERLDARMPLPPRDGNGRIEAWRQR